MGQTGVPRTRRGVRRTEHTLAHLHQHYALLLEVVQLKRELHGHPLTQPIIRRLQI